MTAPTVVGELALHLRGGAAQSGELGVAASLGEVADLAVVVLQAKHGLLDRIEVQLLLPPYGEPFVQARGLVLRRRRWSCSSVVKKRAGLPARAYSR